MIQHEVHIEVRSYDNKYRGQRSGDCVVVPNEEIGLKLTKALTVIGQETIRLSNETAVWLTGALDDPGEQAKAEGNVLPEAPTINLFDPNCRMLLSRKCNPGNWDLSHIDAIPGNSEHVAHALNTLMQISSRSFLVAGDVDERDQMVQAAREALSRIIPTDERCEP